ncbi:protein of unknown function [Methylotuvimicrobium alcaliphilum 20Z]|uniref:Uncharacterized protein n=1 Tax=Methylotuvimicrobium alcaliphilum (strain DSM 19304 / NCIMB 14124 / VKM B-2133 / 20Z) TaxID=1091494 RepID=G4T3I2_META2|nr:protein of unknown function [Methylotuvimicrobium alcaliphilum 20Z]
MKYHYIPFIYPSQIKIRHRVPVKGRREDVYVGSMPAKPLPNTPAPPQALPKFEVREVRKV